MRTRMYDGVTGKAGDGLPMSISFAQNAEARLQLRIDSSSIPFTQWLKMSRERVLTGSRGVEDLRVELLKRGYSVKIMALNNRGFDAVCCSPNGKDFRVEVKTSDSRGTQIPIQPHHVDGELDRDLFYIFVKTISENHIPSGYYFLTHEELRAAWTLMPRRSLTTNQPYSLKTRYLDWCLLRLHRDRWYKLPK